jgi:LysR family transcriptional activator for leuABCD operon
MINLRRIDLNLLTVFEALYEEGSQVKAAERLGMTQSAVSQSVARLRHLLNDRLFQGNGKKLSTTLKADVLYERIHFVLNIIRQEFPDRYAFDPETSQRTFVVAVSHGGGVQFTTQLNASIQALAPHARLSIRTVDPISEIPQLLRDQRIDVAIHHRRFQDSGLDHAVYDNNKLVLIAKSSHSRINKDPTTDEILKEKFVTANDVFTAGTIDLGDMNEILKDRTVLEVPNALLIPQIVKQTELLAVVTAEMAYAFSQYLPVRQYALPFDVPRLPIYMVWHHAMSNDPGHIWLREQLMNIRKTWQNNPIG